MLMLDRTFFSSCMTVVDSGKFAREHLTYITIEYDEEKKTLCIVGTNAQVMIINEIKITQASEQEFCKQAFSEKGKGYMLPQTVLTDKKNLYCIFKMMDGHLMCNDSIVGIFDGQYPNWRAVVPQDKYLQPATYYASFCPAFINLINKALGRKDSGIAGERPLVSGNDNDAHSESLAPHIWKYTGDNNTQTVLLMPMRL